MELAIENAFNVVPFNKETEKDLIDIYYFFKKANLKWRLFKRQALFMEARQTRYKRPSGTRWVEHQVAAIDAYLKNLPVLIGFFNQQIAAPHNNSMKKCVPRLQGLEEQTAKVENILYMAVKQDVLEMVQPLSKTLQDNDLLTPELLTAVAKCVKALRKVQKLVRECGSSVFTQFDHLFPASSGIIIQLKESEDDIIINDRPLRNRVTDNTTNSSLHGFRLCGSLDRAIERNKDRIVTILAALVDVVNKRFSELIDNPIFKAMAVFMDTTSFGEMGDDIIVANMRVIVEKFHRQLVANGCDIDHLEDELQTALAHVSEFLENVSPSNAWKVLFEKKMSLGLSNLLHVVELCIVIPLGNAEVERIFSLLWRIFCKERSSLSNKVQEDLLRLRGSVVAKEVVDYADAIELFLTEYPDGNVRKRCRRTSGRAYPLKRKSRLKKPRMDILTTINDLVSSSDDEDSDESSGSNALISDIDLDQISDDSDEWSSDDEIDIV